METLIKILITLGVMVVMLPFVAWGFMLAVGVIHHEWLTDMPTIGYKSSLIVCAVALPLIRLTVFPGNSSKDD